MSLIFVRYANREAPIELCVSEEGNFWSEEITDWTALKLIADLSNMLACRPRRTDSGSTQEK
jgi:hypothetical protein